ncbi:MAG: VWA domain-containing protein, partial [Erysipelotrichaceae bacterium]
MKKVLNSGLCIMLISLLVLPTIFANIHATQPIGEDHHDSFPVISEGTNESDYPKDGEPGNVKMRKSAKWTDKKAGRAEIKFELSGKPTNSDVVIVLDRSGSMADAVEGSSVSCGGTIVQNKCMKCGKKHSAPAPMRCDDRDRLAISQGAATNFVNAMLANDEQGKPSNNRVGFVSFSGKSGDPAIDNTLQIVTSTNFVDGNGKQALISSINSLEHLGGTDYTPALEAAKKMIMHRTDETRPASIIFLTDGMPAPGQDGIASAVSLKKMNVKVYSLALAIKNPTAKALLRDQIAYDKNCYYDIVNPNDIQSVFNEIKKSVSYAGSNAILSDTIKNHFVYDSSKPVLVNGVVDRNQKVRIVNQDVTWDVGNILSKPTTLIIPIRLNPNQDGVFPTNEGNAKLIYTNFKHNPKCMQEVESPILRKNEQTFTILYEGNPPLGTSLIGNIPKDDLLYQLDEKATILPYGNLSIKDYTFIGWLAGNTLYQPNEIISIKENTVFKAVWEKNKATDLPYTIKYYKDNIDMNTDVSGSVLSDNNIVHKVSYDNLPKGYEIDYDTSTPLPFNVTTENNVIKVAYKKIKEIDPPIVSLPYTIKYYKDNIDMNTDVSGSVLSDNNIIHKVSYDNLPKGYEIDYDTSTPLPFNVT